MDYLVFALSILLILSLFRACSTIRILKKYFCAKLPDDEDAQVLYNQQKNKSQLTLDILYEFVLLLRDISCIIMAILVLVLQQRTITLGKRFHAVYLIKKKKNESVLV